MTPGTRHLPPAMAPIAALRGAAPSGIAPSGVAPGGAKTGGVASRAAAAGGLCSARPAPVAGTARRRRALGGACVLALASLLAAPNAAARVLDCGERPADASRVAVAGGSLVEILYALGEQDHIVAVDRTSNYPEAAKQLPQIGYVRNISAEGLLSLEPSFVLGEHDTGPPEVVEQLARLGVDMLLVPEQFSVAGIRAKIRCVAAAMGADAAGETLAASLLAGVVGLSEDVPGEGAPGHVAGGNIATRDMAGKVAGQALGHVAGNVAGNAAEKAAPRPRGVVLLGLREGAPIAAGFNTSGQGLLNMAGAVNLMDFEGWKPVSVEVMAAVGPEFIVIPNRGVQMAGGLQALLEHPALRLTPAARERRVITMDGMAMLGFGPRTVRAAAELRARLRADHPRPEGAGQ